MKTILTTTMTLGLVTVLGSFQTAGALGLGPLPTTAQANQQTHFQLAKRHHRHKPRVYYNAGPAVPYYYATPVVPYYYGQPAVPAVPYYYAPPAPVMPYYYPYYYENPGFSIRIF